jgi:DNA-binding transcriptional LysR family regulator
MDMKSITMEHGDEPDLRQLRVLEVLLREGTLTRAAQALNVTQPALSKTLAKLRRYFSDPLFVRVGNRMEPTSKTLELEPAVAGILDQVTTLRARHVPFDPSRSARVFSFSVVDAGVVRLLPPLMTLLEESAPGVRLRVLPIETERLEPLLESGHLDFAMGSYPSLTKRIRRQRLWSLGYVCAVRKGHPRVREALPSSLFAAERHVLVSAEGTGHAHSRVERAVRAHVPAEKIVCTVPTFVTAAVIASLSDAIVTLPDTLALEVAGRLGLRLIEPPIRLPRIDVCQYWHERFHREPGNQWIREVFVGLFGEQGAGSR